LPEKNYTIKTMCSAPLEYESIYIYSCQAESSKTDHKMII